MALKKYCTALLLLLPVSIVAQSSRSSTLRLKDLNDRPINLVQYKGKVLLVNFWATWCVPCRTEIPDLIKWQSDYRDDGLRIIGITYPPARVAEVRRFVKKRRMNYRIAIGTKATKALFTSSDTLPMTVVIDREGAVRDVIEGIMYADEFDEKVKPLLLQRVR